MAQIECWCLSTGAWAVGQNSAAFRHWVLQEHIYTQVTFGARVQAKVENLCTPLQCIVPELWREYWKKGFFPSSDC